MIIQYGAPTLAGLKTGSLFTVPYENKRQLKNDVRDINRRLHTKGLTMCLIRFMKDRALLYLMRPDMLAQDIRCPEARALLQERGYTPDFPDKCISHLCSRVNHDGEFPHEIGLFLGYPASDVRGFIENRPCLFAGQWKVYSEPEKAVQKFALYTRCTKLLERCYSGGMPLEELASNIQGESYYE